ncbi:putative golgin subfamily A member 6-like protein 3 [Syngnathus acus]|uniref:putative golgin subfamily A member 6-like protein 3 n=1 Tax=Syngnathus acus TaxID=161584 RepID=UPI001885B194|nr:putative golgin subfamily A member 6-like protein 3 [Syngnathus acus]
MFSFCGSPSDSGRGSEGYEQDKVGSKSSSLKNKEVLNQDDTSLCTEKPEARAWTVSPLSERLSIADKSEEQTAEKISLLEVLSKAHSNRAGRYNRNAVYDDIALSDDEGRSQSTQNGIKQRMEKVGGVSEYLDDFTPSSFFTQDDQFRVKPKAQKAKDDLCVVAYKNIHIEDELANLRSSSKQQQEDCLNTIKMAQVNILELEQELQKTHDQLCQERSVNTQLQQKLKQQTKEDDGKSSKHLKVEEELQQAHDQLRQEREANTQQRQKPKTHDCKQETTTEKDCKRSKHREEDVSTELEAHSSIQQKEEHETLNEQLGDVRQDLRLTSDIDAQSFLEWNNMITGFKCEVTVANARLAKAEQLRLEMEKALLHEKEEQERLKEQLAIEKANREETLTSLTQELSKAKAYGSSMENELLEREAQYIQVMKEMKEQASFLDERKGELCIAALRQKEAHAAADTVSEEVEQRLESDDLSQASSVKQDSEEPGKESNEASRVSALTSSITNLIVVLSDYVKAQMLADKSNAESSSLHQDQQNIEPPPPETEEVEINEENDSNGSGEVTGDDGKSQNQQPANEGRDWHRDFDVFLDLQRCGFEMLERELNTLNNRLQSLQIWALPLLTSIDCHLQRLSQQGPGTVRSKWALRRWGRSTNDARRVADDRADLISNE